MKTFVRVAGVAAAVVIGLALVLVLALKFAVPEERLRAEVLGRVAAATGYDIEVESVGLGLTPRGVALKATGVQLDNPAIDGEASRFLLVDGLEVGVGLLPLLRREVDVRRLRLVAPVIQLVKEASGQLNVQVAADRSAADSSAVTVEAAESPIGVALAVPRAEIVGGRFSYRDAEEGVALDVNALDATLKASVRGNELALGGTIQLAESTLRRGADSEPIGPLDVTLTLDGKLDQATDRLELHDTSVALAELAVDVEGQVEGVSGQPTLDLSLATGRFEPGRLLPLVRSLAGDSIPNDLAIGGAADWQGKVSGPANGPALAGTLSLDGVSVSLPAVSAAGPLVEAVSGALQLTADGARVPRLTGKVAGGPFQLSGELENLTAPTVDLHVEFEGELAELARRAGTEGVQIDSGQLAVDLTVNAAAGTPLESLDARGSVRVDGLAAAVPGVQPPLSDVHCQATLAGRRITAEDFKARLGESDLSGTWSVADVASPKVNFALHSGFLNLNELLPEPGAQRGATPDRGAQPAQEGEAAAKPAVPAAGTVRVAKLRIRDLDATDVGLKVNLDESGLRVRDVTGNALGGRLAGGFAARPAGGDRLTYDSNLKVTGVEADQLLAALTPVRDLVYGKMDLNLDLSGTRVPNRSPLDHLTAEGHSLVTGGYLAAQGVLATVLTRLGVQDQRLDFEELASKVAVKDGRLLLDNGKLLSGKHGEFHLGGSIGFDKTLAVEVRSLLPKRSLPKEVTTNAQLTRLLANEDGRVPIQFSVTGTFGSPTIRIDTAALEKQLRDQVVEEAKTKATGEVEKAAKDLLKGLFKKK